MNDLHVLDVDSFTWEEPETLGTVPAKRNNHTTTVVGNKIFLHGGHDGNQWLDDLHIFNTTNMTWQTPTVSGQVLFVI